ncbi:MAG: glutamine synthetase III [Spirochaetales bacterium]|nr:glutamine synthetase III [Spirochaetales bacterium]
MKEKLPKSIYKAIKKVQAGEGELNIEVAEVVATAMKDWAIDNGATHYTHWFQPLTGLTAEKHDSFISPTGDGKVILEFSGKELVKGEPDASSFPSGGIRNTFEARGYTAWDVTSPAFLKQDNSGVTLYIPTAFVSYTGEALDKKVPLLRSMDAVSAAAMRVLKSLGNTTSKRVISTVGPEQEYFLVEKELFAKRMDLQLCGRTLYGAMAPKGQELEDHYFGTIKERVADFMRELNYELWKLGISAKTQHNEVAPNQFELAPIYETSNIAADNNQLVMDTMRKVAARHDLVCLLHEKPFAGVNGSGKHNNWSISTDDGINLLEPGSNPQENAQFLLFLAAVIKAVDSYSPILRMSAANSGNDHRLGANEAPPAIISMFLGEQLSEILENLAAGKASSGSGNSFMEIGTSMLPKLPKDLTDRNRTSPFAFTGNKFEFRMVPSSESISGPNVVLNTIVAEVLNDFASILESASDKKTAIQKIVLDTYKTHKKIIFNGNNYSDDWVAEAEKRGLPNIKSTVAALKALVSDDVVKVFEKNKVLTKRELHSRYEIYLEKYAKQINIEAGCAIRMAKNEILPACTSFIKKLADTINSVKTAGINAVCAAEHDLASKVSALVDKLYTEVGKLEKVLATTQGISDIEKQAISFRDDVFAQMLAVRQIADSLELLVEKSYWPFPSYSELLFNL